jgi:hypothetical protein
MDGVEIKNSNICCDEIGFLISHPLLLLLLINFSLNQKESKQFEFEGLSLFVMSVRGEKR